MKICSTCGTCYDDSEQVCAVDQNRLGQIFAGSAILDNKYHLNRLMGYGGMGAVFRAQHLALQKLFAVKIILPDKINKERFLKRFQREAQALGALKHENIVQVTDFGVDTRQDGIPYLVMEYLEGRTLKHLILTQGSSTVEQVIPFLEGVATALDYVHSRGVVHRDVKPSNLFLCDRNDDVPLVKLFDFGVAQSHRFSEMITPLNSDEGRDTADPVDDIASDDDATVSEEDPLGALGPPAGVKEEETMATGSGDYTQPLTVPAVEQTEARKAEISGSSLFSNVCLDSAGGIDITRPGEVVGTLPYVAPEILNHKDKGSPSSDIYSLGIMVYELVAGERPFQGSPTKIAYGHVFNEPRKPSEINQALDKSIDETILKALAKDPEIRPSSALEYIRSLKDTWLETKKKAWRKQERNRRLILALVTALVVLVLVVPITSFTTFKDIDNKILNMLISLQSPVPPHPGLLILSLGDEIMDRDKADELAPLLSRIMEAGAKTLAIDFLLHENWSRSSAFTDLVLAYHDKIVLAALSSQDGQVLGTECLKGKVTLVLGQDDVSKLFGFTNISQDPDGYARRLRAYFLDQNGHQRKTFAALAVEVFMGKDSSVQASGEQKLVNTAVDWSSSKVAWTDLSRLLEENPRIFANRLVVVGGEYSDYEDIHRIAPVRGNPSEVAGVVLQALMMNTLLTVSHIREIPRTVLGMSLLLPLAILSYFLLFMKPGLGGLKITAFYSGVVTGSLLVVFLLLNSCFSLTTVLIAGVLGSGATVQIRKKLEPFPH